MDYTYLADTIENIMFKQGEYDYSVSDREIWLNNISEPYTLSNPADLEEARNTVRDNIRNSLKTDEGRKQLTEYLRYQVSDIQNDKYASRVDIDIMTKSIKIVNNLLLNIRDYGTNKDLDKCVDDEHYASRILMAHQGYGLNVLVNDVNPAVRIEVVRAGYGLDVLSKDPVDSVRAEVALQGYNLKDFINDDAVVVRCAVAEMDYGLSQLINDDSYVVRASVAKRDYGLDELKNDEHEYVRMQVAKQGAYLDELIKDNNNDVRMSVAQNGKNKHLDILCNDTSAAVRCAVAERGRLKDLAVLINDSSPIVVEVASKTMLEKVNQTLDAIYNRYKNSMGNKISYTEFENNIRENEYAIEQWAEGDEINIMHEYLANYDKYNCLMTEGLHALLEDDDKTLYNKGYNQGYDALDRLLNYIYNKAQTLDAGQDISQKIDEYMSVTVYRDPEFERNTPNKSQYDKFSIDIFSTEDKSRIAFTDYIPSSELKPIINDIWITKGKPEWLADIDHVTLDKTSVIREKQMNNIKDER